jgi:hypothetical protein
MQDNNNSGLRSTVNSSHYSSTGMHAALLVLSKLYYNMHIAKMQYTAATLSSSCHCMYLNTGGVLQTALAQSQAFQHMFTCFITLMILCIHSDVHSGACLHRQKVMQVVIDSVNRSCRRVRAQPLNIFTEQAKHKAALAAQQRALKKVNRHTSITCMY